jgi:MFS family permease
VFEITGSAFHLGLIGLVQFVPVVPTSLVAGVVADSSDRRRIVLAAESVAMLLCAGLWAMSRGGDAPLLGIYAVIFTLALAHAFASPAGSALLPTLVPPALFPSATAVHSTFRNLGWATGPMVAGFVIDAGGVAVAYATSALLFACSLAALALLRGHFNVHERRAVSRQAITEGIAFVRGHRVVLSSMTLDMFAVVFASVTALLPVYADEILGVGPRGYGLLSSALELGTLAMAALLLALPPIQRPGRALLIAVFGFGLATIAFGLSRSFALSLAALVVAGMADQVSQVARSIIVQLSTPDALRGRVNSVNMVFISASNQLGAVESGFLAALVGAPVTVVFGGIACLGVLAVVASGVPELRAHRTPGLDPRSA